MSGDSTTEIEDVLESLEELFERDEVQDYHTDPDRPYDIAVKRVQIHGKAPFYLENSEAVALRVLPVRTHSVEGRSLRLEVVESDQDGS